MMRFITILVIAVVFSSCKKEIDPIPEIVVEDHFYLGQDTLGGIVFYLYEGKDKKQHGLIVAKTESSAIWQTTNSTVSAWSHTDGVYNTSVIINSPAVDYVKSLGDGWYLPASEELYTLLINRYIVDKALTEGGYPNLSFDIYWSSSEVGVDRAEIVSFGFAAATIAYTNKNFTEKVRAIRSF